MTHRTRLALTPLMLGLAAFALLHTGASAAQLPARRLPKLQIPEPIIPPPIVQDPLPESMSSVQKEWLLNALRSRQQEEAALVLLVERRGAAFIPNAEDDKELREAGATDRLLEAVRKNYAPQGRSGGMSIRVLLTRDWLLRALRERHLDEDRIVWWIEVNGSNYFPDAEGERELRAAGATDRILATLRKCQRVELSEAGGQKPPAAPVDYTRPFEYCQLTTPAVVTHRPYPADIKEDPFKNEGPLKNGRRPGVHLSMVLNPDGTVTDIRVLTDLPDKLTKKFVAAAKQIKFSPAEKDGRKVAERTTLVYFFGY